MIEVVIKKYLDEHLSVPVFLEYPKIPPDSFVLFEKTGSGKRNHLNDCTIAFQSYGATMYEAATLNEALKKAVEQMVKLSQISKVQLNSDYNFTDTMTKEYRYQAVFDFYYYDRSE